MQRTLFLVLAVVAAWLACSACSRRGVATVSDKSTSDEEGHAATPPPDASAPPPVSGAETGPFFEQDPQARPVRILRGDAPNLRYIGLDHDKCLAELEHRAIKTEAAPPTKDVLIPRWLRGPLHNGITLHSQLTPSQREHSSVEIFDCRLLLALDDFATLLAEHDVVEIIHMSAYRPRNAMGCTPKYVGKQHCAALAVDVGWFKKKDGSVLEVLRDFHGKVGLATCTQSAKPNPKAAPSDELWTFVCESARRATFNVILTPNFNVQHKNHFHLELTPDANWMLIH